MKRLSKASSYSSATVAFVALALAAVGCSSHSAGTSSPGSHPSRSSGTEPSTSPSASPSRVGWATATSAQAGGGMQALVAAAKQEGRLNVIALPPTWANYRKIVKNFERRYGIVVHSADPGGTSQDEVSAVRRESGAASAPDVLDIDMAVAQASAQLFAPYQVSTWPAIPASQKEPTGLWVQDYGGYMSVGYNSARFGTITSLSQLLGRGFRGTVALNGDPAQAAATAAQGAVMMASLAAGGSPDSVASGITFFGRLRKAGNFSSIQATTATIRSGQTEVVFDWDYLNTASFVGLPSWKVLVPSDAVLGSFYAQAISKKAPHPAAARLWEEYLYSQSASGGQNLWLEGGVRPVEQAAMTLNGSINAAAAAKLPPVSGTPVFLTAAQAAAAASYLRAHWASVVR